MPQIDREIEKFANVIASFEMDLQHWANFINRNHLILCRYAKLLCEQKVSCWLNQKCSLWFKIWWATAQNSAYFQEARRTDMGDGGKNKLERMSEKEIKLFWKSRKNNLIHANVCHSFFLIFPLMVDCVCTFTLYNITALHEMYICKLYELLKYVYSFIY